MDLCPEAGEALTASSEIDTDADGSHCRMIVMALP